MSQRHLLMQKQPRAELAGNKTVNARSAEENPATTDATCAEGNRAHKWRRAFCKGPTTQGTDGGEFRTAYINMVRGGLPNNTINAKPAEQSPATKVNPKAVSSVYIGRQYKRARSLTGRERANMKRAEESPANAKHAEESPADAKCAEENHADAKDAEESPADTKTAEENPANKHRRRFDKGSKEWIKHDLFRRAFNMVNSDGSWKLHPSLDSKDLPGVKPRELDVLHIVYFRLEAGG